MAAKADEIVSDVHVANIFFLYRH